MILLYDVFQAYGQVKSISLWLSAFAAVVAGFRIYQRWNKGDDIEQSVIIWMTGIAACGGAIALVDRFIMSGALSSSFGGSDYLAQQYTAGLAIESARAALWLGVIVAIIGLIRVYQKFQRGDEDIYEFMLKWFGSLVFLFLMGSLISAML
jgi:uncharacterized membrane protein